jgi:hypothetical protein
MSNQTMTNRYKEKRIGAHPLCKDLKEFWSLKPKGDFCCGGPADLPAPGLFVDGVGEVTFPLQPNTVQALNSLPRHHMEKALRPW